MKKIVLATRESPLALWQAHHVQGLLGGLHPGLAVDLLGMTTRGDRILDRALAKVGGKGLFIKELEVALLERRADAAVHSLKDVPMLLEPGFALTAVLEREDPRDCLVSPRFSSLAELPAGARVGTSSLRRELMLRARYPHLQILPVRGNVGTRLGKLDQGEFDALIMATAGLKRLGHGERVRAILPADEFLPAPGQGALAIEARAGDAAVAAIFEVLEHPATRAAVLAERAVSRGLAGSCEVPLAAYAEVQGEQLWLRALAGNAQRGEFVACEARGPVADPEGLAAGVVGELKARGALQLLAA